ncbi:MAG: UDP-N-acetylmuramoyl-tripeptide--D-alanyl-D-alanine ligase [Firmicutes bacterium]|nr:UDP-N-acetylmuramoyl-tripeptide--D-alanyl-D-alanine ligase [Bacillota bacterium]
MSLFIISIFAIIIYTIIDLKKAFHMLQQNWYNDGNRYLKWINNNRKFIFFWYDGLFILLFFIGLIFKGNILSIAVIIYYFLIAYKLLNIQKNEQVKKPLAFTARIKRMCITILVLYLIPICFMISNFSIQYLPIYYLVLGGLVYFNFYIVYLANIINKPVEKLVYLYYKTKALKKLKSLTNTEVVAVTGSYGKTSTKNIISDILNVRYIAFPTPQNFNTNYGLIRTINEYIDKYNDYFIAELGAFRMGDIKQRSSIVKPKYGVLTKIGTAHLDTFGCIENTTKAKFELIESLPSDGVGFLNIDDEAQVNYELKNKIKIVWYGLSDKADIYATDINYSSDGMSFKVHFKNDSEDYLFKTRLLGEANVYNILAGIAVARELGLNISQLQQGVLKIKPIEHRLQMKKYGNITYIDDAYNSNPVGSKMALDVLKLMPGKKIVITPGMIEMGDMQYEVNYNFGTFIADSVDLAILVGKEQTKPIQQGIKDSKFDKEKLIVVNDVKEAIAIAQNSYPGEEVYILLENDLPDLFNEK